MIGIRGFIKTTAPRFAAFAFGSRVCTQRYYNLTRSITASNRKGFFHSLFPSSLHYSTRSIHDVPKEDQFQFKTEEFPDQHALALTNKYDDGIVTVVVRVPDVVFSKDAYNMFSEDQRVIYKPPPFIPFLVKVSHNLNLKLWCTARPYEISLDRLKLISDTSNPTALEVMESLQKNFSTYMVVKGINAKVIYALHELKYQLNYFRRCLAKHSHLLFEKSMTYESLSAIFHAAVYDCCRKCKFHLHLDPSSLRSEKEDQAKEIIAQSFHGRQVRCVHTFILSRAINKGQTFLVKVPGPLVFPTKSKMLNKEESYTFSFCLTKRGFFLELDCTISDDKISVENLYVEDGADWKYPVRYRGRVPTSGLVRYIIGDN